MIFFHNNSKIGGTIGPATIHDAKDRSEKQS